MLPEHELLFKTYFYTKDIRERNELVLGNIGLVKKTAAKWANNSNVPYSDLEQIGSLALIDAIERFNPFKGIKFSCFALPYINGRILHYLRDKSSVIRTPRADHSLYQKAQKFRSTCPNASDSEIADHLGISLERWHQCLIAKQSAKPSDIDSIESLNISEIEENKFNLTISPKQGNEIRINDLNLKIAIEFCWGKPIKLIAKELNLQKSQVVLALNTINTMQTSDSVDRFSSLSPVKLSLLAFFKTSPLLSAATLANKTGKSKQTVTNTLRSLVKEGFLTKDDNRHVYMPTDESVKYLKQLPEIKEPQESVEDVLARNVAERIASSVSMDKVINHLGRILSEKLTKL